MSDSRPLVNFEGMLMPTGYAGKITDDISFAEWAMLCAHNFLGEMYDKPMDAPIPEAFYPSERYAAELEKARTEYERLCGLRPDEIEAESRATYASEHERWGNNRREVAALRHRLERMLTMVEEWQPPTKEHAGLKRFMMEQIRSGLEGDCAWIQSEPRLMTTVSWLRAKLDHALANIAYYERKLRDSKRNAEWSTRWVTELRASLWQGTR